MFLVDRRGRIRRSEGSGPSRAFHLNRRISDGAVGSRANTPGVGAFGPEGAVSGAVSTVLFLKS